jgi:uncharacterized membrane protein YcfT
MHYVVEFARPFRMPDFFLISGLFVSQVIDRPWRLYLDRKVVQFAYFYVLWTAIQFVFKAPGIASDHNWHHVGLMYLQSFIEPFGILWFIYLLPIFFLVTRITRQLPSTLIWIIAAALEISHISTGWTVIDEFASRLFVFYAGFRCAPAIFTVAANAEAYPRSAAGGLIVWAAVNGAVVASGTAVMPGISLALGLAGALAIVVRGVLLARTGQLGALRFAVQQSIIVYLAFFLHDIYAHRPDQEWVNCFCGIDVDHRDHDGSSRSFHDVAGGYPNRAAFPVRTTETVLAFVNAPHG